MKVSNWEKRTAIAQVSIALKTYSLTVEKNFNTNIQGDIIGAWKRTGKKYLFSIVPRIKLLDLNSEHFKSTLLYCRANNLRLVVIAWECDAALEEYMTDSKAKGSIEFKIIEFSRMEMLKKDFLELKSVA